LQWRFRLPLLLALIVAIGTPVLLDAQGLQPWGLHENDLSPVGTVTNRQINAWESYKWYTITGISVIITELLVIGTLLRHRARRKNIEQALTTSEKVFSEVFRRSPMAQTIIRASDDRYMDVNETFEYFTGWKKEEVLGRTSFEMGHWKNPEERAHVWARLFTGQPVRNFQFSVCTKNGEVRTRLGSAELIELHGERYILIAATDITDLKQAETTLRESEERFRLVANTAPVMIWMSGTDKRCTYFNRPWLEFTGRSIKQEMGNGWVEGVHPEDRARCLETYTKAFDCREPFGMEYRLRRADGEYRWVFDSGVARFNADRSFAGYIGSAIDITERKLAEEILSKVNHKLIEAQEEERARIAREIHDDISQRLSLLVLKLERLKRNGQSKIAGSGDPIGEALGLASEINRDTQALSHRLHSSKLEHLGITATAAGYCREIAEQREVMINFQSSFLPNDMPLEISLCLFRVLQEALQNAIKHSGAQKFHVSLIRQGNEIHLTVRDSGKGFDPAPAISRRGLGITSMKERLKLVNGQLNIDSRSEHGTTVHACVPLDSAMKFVNRAGT
jgi:PAS domain S-box-containing protein